MSKLKFTAQNKIESYTICLSDDEILFCKRAGNVGVNAAVKHYLKRLWLVSIATLLSKTLIFFSLWSIVGYHVTLNCSIKDPISRYDICCY